jgi:hypothetical protein
MGLYDLLVECFGLTSIEDIYMQMSAIDSKCLERISLKQVNA